MSKVKLNLKPFGLPSRSMFVNDDDVGLSVDLKTYGFREPINTYYFSRLLRRLDKCRGDLDVVDIGGNIGYFPLIESLSFGGRITVCEPVPDSFEVLSANMLWMSRVELFNCAVGAYTGSARMVVSPFRNLSRIEPKGIRVGNDVEVVMVSLDDLLKDKDDVLLRFDVEGYEEQILSDDVPDCVSYLVFELHPSILGYSSVYDLVESLEMQGFKLMVLISDIGSNYWSWFKWFGMMFVHAYNSWAKCIYECPDFDIVDGLLDYYAERGICPHLYFKRL